MIEVETDRRGPSDLQLFLEGVGMAVPAYFLGVAAHEGSHALGVVMAGGEVTDISVLPSKLNGRFVFGYTSWQGEFTKTERMLISIAPKITDLAMMGTYTALFETGAYPRNKHLQVVLIVLATTAWVDFTKDIIVTHPDNDLVRFYDGLGFETESERLPMRLLHGAISLAAAIEIGRGIYRLFTDGPEPEHGGRRMLFGQYGEPVVTGNYIGWRVQF
jgi:hypothetical protein